MDSSFLYSIKDLCESFLGSPRVESDIEGWFDYDCPNCADIEGTADGKHNLPISYKLGYCHCWKCGFSASIGSLIKRYGGEKLYHQYRSVLKEISLTMEFQLNMFDDDNKNYLIDIQNYIELPQSVRDIVPNTKAWEYLYNRGITQDIISKYKIQEAPWSDDYKCRNRIVIPSFSKYGDLNYYIARDYTGKQKLKYANPQVPKTSIIFNENLINWYDAIYLCEGVFDSIVIPNSIPMLGKKLSEDSVLYQTLIKEAQSEVVVFLDDDAYEDAIKLYHTLNNTSLNGRLKIIETPKGYDPSLIHQKYGRQGMLDLIRRKKILQ